MTPATAGRFMVHTQGGSVYYYYYYYYYYKSTDYSDASLKLQGHFTYKCLYQI